MLKIFRFFRPYQWEGRKIRIIVFTELKSVKNSWNYGKLGKKLYYGVCVTSSSCRSFPLLYNNIYYYNGQKASNIITKPPVNCTHNFTHTLSAHFTLTRRLRRKSWKFFAFFVISVAEKDNSMSSFYRIEFGQELRDIRQVRIWASNVVSVAMKKHSSLLYVVCFICNVHTHLCCNIFHPASVW